MPDGDQVTAGALARWYISFGLFGVPQAAAPIAFALASLPLTGSARSGAVIMTAMTAAQLIGAVPVARLGRNRNAVSFLKLLIAIKTTALIALAIVAGFGAPFAFLVAAAAIAGLVHGAAYGYIRSVLNYLVEPTRRVKAIGIGVTLSEISFVTAPVMASALGAVSPSMAIATMALVGAAPIILVPRLEHARMEDQAAIDGPLISPAVLLCLFCAGAGGAAVGAIEVGAVSIAISYGLAPGMGVVFTTALCLASVTGGVWLSVRNRMFGHSTVVLLLAAMAAGMGLVSQGYSVQMSVVGCVLVGLTLAPLSTQYTLVLENLVPTDMRSEAFALLRTASSIGIIVTTAMLAWTSLSIALMTGATLLVLATAAASASRNRFR